MVDFVPTVDFVAPTAHVPVVPVLSLTLPLQHDAPPSFSHSL